MVNIAHRSVNGAAVMNSTIPCIEFVGVRADEAATVGILPHPLMVAATNSELMCVRPSLIRVLEAGRSGRTGCSPIDLIGRNPVDGAVKAWSPGLRAVTGDNPSSCGGGKCRSSAAAKASSVRGEVGFAPTAEMLSSRGRYSLAQLSAGVAPGPQDSISINSIPDIARRA
jgi:hypothetical protein